MQSELPLSLHHSALKTASAAILGLWITLSLLHPSAAAAERPPNVVIIFADDQGYADVGCFGAKGFETPNLDQLAAEGMKLTNFYVSQAVCGASRTSLLTGCYANRLQMLGAPGPSSTHGIAKREWLISEMLKAEGYKTAIYGKWHLGHHQKFLPLQHGFDEYYGLPYSNDMWPYHPTNKSFPKLPLMEGNKIANDNVTMEDQRKLTTQYTERAVDFIERNRETPFFLYVAHAMPHVPLAVSDKFAGKSEQGLYGDVIMEIDWCVGEIVSALKKHKLDKNTLVIYTSDNGPWLSYGNHAGSAGPLREGKGTMWEGGARVPCIAWWPGKIPAGRECSEIAATIDVLPTIAEITGGKLSDNKIDGSSIWPLLAGEAGATSPHKAYHYYFGNELRAVRSGDWKLVFPHQYRSLTGEAGKDGLPAGYTQAKCGLELYNLADDIGEQKNVLDAHPDIIKELQQHAEDIRKQIGDSLKGMTGSERRQPDRL